MNVATEAQTPAEAAERERLEILRGERLVIEELDSMTDEERDHLAAADKRRINDVFANARAQEERDTLAAIEKEYEAEAIEWRNTHHGANTLQRGSALREAEQRKREKIQAWMQARQDRELKAEAYADETERLIHSLGDRGRAILAQSVNDLPSHVERMRASKQAVQRQNYEAQQWTLYTQMMDEMKAKNARTPTHTSNIRAKYYQLGLNPAYQPGE